MKKITLDHITKVEGHAEVNISIRDGEVKKCQVVSVEGARYFESIIKGRKYDEITLITSRICGICSCGHTIASITAIEDALQIKPTIQTELLRELITIGERIRSHASHLYFFVLPDFLGFGSAIEMAKKYPEEVRNCLEMIRIGNELIQTIGGRDMHPFMGVVGGFTSIAEPEKFTKILSELKNIIPLAEKTLKLFSSLEIPEYEKKDTVFISLENHKTFPLHTGKIVSNTGLEFDPKDYKKFIAEYFEKDSTANFAMIAGKEFMTGALARCNNSLDKLSKNSQKFIKKLKGKHNFPSANLFLNSFAQAIEILHWTERAIEILDNNSFQAEEIAELDVCRIKGQKTQGISAIEVPRGILFHDYKFNEEGILEEANIITPTVQNLAEMELSVRCYLNDILKKDPEKDKDELVLEIEKMVRAFDPCFSCSTHFLKVNWE